MKTAVSIPDDLFERVDAFATRAGKSRSEVYADALKAHLSRQADPTITARLDKVYADVEPAPDDRAWIESVAAGIVARNDW